MPQYKLGPGTVFGYKMYAGETLVAGRFVKLSSGTIKAIAATTDLPIGVLLEKTAREDVKVPVQLDGVIKCEAGGACTEGNEVKIDSSGRVVNSSHASGDSIVGQALETTATSGAYILVKLGFQDIA